MTPSIARKIARGTVRAGSRTSPLGTSAVSTPRNAKMSTTDARETCADAGRRRPVQILASASLQQPDDDQQQQRHELGDRHHALKRFAPRTPAMLSSASASENHDDARRVAPIRRERRDRARRARRRRTTRRPPSPR